MKSVLSIWNIYFYYWGWEKVSAIMMRKIGVFNCMTRVIFQHRPQSGGLWFQLKNAGICYFFPVTFFPTSPLLLSFLLLIFLILFFLLLFFRYFFSCYFLSYNRALMAFCYIAIAKKKVWKNSNLQPYRCNSDVRKWKCVFDHQGWVQNLSRTKENYYFAINE